MAEYKVRCKSAAGVLVAEVSDFLRLAYDKRVNEPGAWSMQVPGDHSVYDLLEHRSQVEIWRRVPAVDLDWYCDFYGLWLDDDYEKDREQVAVRTLSGPGQMWLLATRHVAWKAGTSNRSAFEAMAAETLLKAVVQYNCTSDATVANGRELDGEITGVSVEADGGGGNSITRGVAWKNVLAVLQDVAEIGGGDFDLVKTGARAWEFRWYSGQRGDDLTETVRLAEEFGTIGRVRYRKRRSSERTVAIVGGPGQGAARAVSVHYGAAYGLHNKVEMFVDARGTKTSSGRTSKAEEALERARAQAEIGFDVLQTPGAAYGQHYDVGDLVSARAFGTTFTPQIVRAQIEVSANGEKIQVSAE